MANITALTKGKGEPPKRGKTETVIKKDTRSNDIKPKNKPLQVMVNPELFDSFSIQAAEMFGHKKGAKSLYFEYLFNNRK